MGHPGHPSVGIIGGTGMDALGDHDRPVEVMTPFGPALARVGQVGAVEAAVILRHGPDHRRLPHEVNYRANLWALRELGVLDVFATVACGSLDPALSPGDLAVVVDFLDLTRDRVQTFRGTPGLPDSAEFYHADLHQPYCPRLRAALRAAAGAGAPPNDATLPPEVVYACMEGPRYETPAEIRMLRQLGAAVVGMTGCPEAALARELGLCFAAVAVVTNAAAGMVDQPLEHEDVERLGREALTRVRRLLASAAALAGRASDCCPAPPRRERWLRG
jgi:5'-methylthioadenosine phosphorylase